MSYRVTNSMMQSLLLNDMHTNLSKLLDVQQQMSTQRKYQSASDNPNAVTKGMGLETMLAEGEQYIKNLQDAVSWLKFTDSAMGDMNDIFQRMRELTITAGNGALEGVDLEAVATELEQLREELRTYANATIAGEYLFAGLKTGTTPFTVGAGGEIVYAGNDYSVQWEFSRREVGKVSVGGREIFPQDEVTHSLKGIELPLDFEWTGRNEILEFKVGWQTVKVRIPERWTDEIPDGVADSTDYNRYRDPGEALDGYSLQEIADLINNSTEMGDVGKLLKATVVTDNERNVQYLKIQSHTGEAVSLTSWPETDAVALAQGIKGAAYGPTGRTAGGDGKISLRFDDETVYTVDVAKGETLEQVADKLNNLPEGRVWAAYRKDAAGNEWIDIVSRDPGKYFNMEATGGAAELFSPELATANSQVVSGNHVLNTNSIANFTSAYDGSFRFTINNRTYDIAIPAGATLTSIETAIEALTDPGGTALFSVDITGDRLAIESLQGHAFEAVATGGMTPFLSDGASLMSGGTKDKTGNYLLETAPVPADFAVTGDGALYYEYKGQRYWVPLAVSDDLDAVKAKLEASFTANGIAGSVTVVDGVDADGNPVKSLAIATDERIRLGGFGSGASVVGTYSVGTTPIETNADHTHIGFAAMMGMETSVSSTEIPVDAAPWDTTGSPLHIKFVSGTNVGEIYIEDNANLTLDEIAKRINSVCGSWLQAVVETDSPDGTNPSADPLNNSGDNLEGGTQRLVLRTLDGSPFAVYDGPGKDAANPAGDYAQMLGINTASMGNSTLAGGEVVYPSAGAGSFFDDNMPAILEVTVGERTYEVKVCRNNCGDAERVAAAIVRQVNEQYGGTLLSWDGNDIKNSTNPNDAGTFALFAVTGEPLRIVDKGYGDPRFTEYTGGVASQLGMAAGITSSVPLTDASTPGPGTMRIGTPGHTVDIPVLAGDTVQDIANRIRDYAGDWLDVSFYDANIDTPGGDVTLSIAAKDGSAVSVLDVTGSAASNMGLDTGLVGGDVSGLNFGTALDDTNGVLTITVNGASHTIDLYDADGTPPGPTVHSIEDLADMINTRFQGQDIRAEVLVTKDAAGNITGKQLALWSPKGYTFEIAGNGAGATDSPAIFGFAAGNTQSPNPSGSGPYNQVVTHRTGTNQKKTDFFGVLDNLINCVKGGNVDGISDTMIGQLDNWMGTLLKCRAQVGALTNRYTTTESRLTSNNTGYEELHTNTVGIDLAEVITEYEMASSIYEASLAAIARIMQPTLLDFLR